VPRPFVPGHVTVTEEPLRREGRYASAIYGSILTTSLIGALHYSTKAGSIALTVIATNAVFWLAHVWSEILGERIERGDVGGLAQFRRLARNEWPMVEAGALPALALAAAPAGLCSDRIATDAALVVSVAQLAGWGLLGAKRSGAGWAKGLLLGVADGLVGLGIVGLESLLH